MNNLFDLRRFGRVLRYTWVTQPQLPYIALLAAIPLIYAYVLRTAASDSPAVFSDDPFILFCFYFIGCSWLYAGLSLREFSRSDSASRYVLLPGSVLEKWLSKMLLLIVVFPLIAWLTFNLAFQGLGVLTAQLFAFRFRSINWVSIDTGTVLFLWLMTLPVVFVSGAVWKRFSFLKSLVFGFILLLVLYFFIEAGFNRYDYRESEGALIRELGLPVAGLECVGNTCFLIHLFWVLAAWLPALLCLVAGYFFMKEKEV